MYIGDLLLCRIERDNMMKGKVADHRVGGVEDSCQKQNKGMDYKRGETELNWGETGAEMDFWIGVPSSQFWRISPPPPRKG